MEFQDPYEHIDSALIYNPENIPTPHTEDSFYEEFTTGCGCSERCAIENECSCLQKSGAFYAIVQESHSLYDRYKITMKDSLKPVYECNHNCKCSGQLCTNRLVQFGPRNHLQIISFKTNGGEDCLERKGLGLKTLRRIKKGNFICEYAGELITKDEAIRRHTINQENSLMNYIFCVNEHFGGHTCSTFIDPSRFGNIGRYLNHSCDPNCEIIPIRISNTIPKLCVFALKDIEEDCELTYDYGNGTPAQNITLPGRIKCLCKSENCRQFLPFDDYVN